MWKEEIQLIPNYLGLEGQLRKWNHGDIYDKTELYFN